MLKQHCLLFLAAIFMVFACNNTSSGTTGDTQESLNELEKKIIAVHDEVMPKMSDIARLSGILETELQNPNLDSAQTESVKGALRQLVIADSLMWDWMHKYSKPENAPEDTVRAYLEKEEERVGIMRKAMIESIGLAEGVAQKLGHAKPN